MAKDGHHSVLRPADIPASTIVEDRNVDLTAGEVDGCVLLHGKGRESFELQHYAWVGMNAGIHIWILTMPHVDQNLQVASLFCRHAKEQGCEQSTTILIAIGKSGLPAPIFLPPGMVIELLTPEPSQEFCCILLFICLVLSEPCCQQRPERL